MTIAFVVCPRGNKGEVAAEPYSRLERFKLLKEVFLFGPGGPLKEGRPYEIQSVWLDRRRLIFKFQGVDSISEAERLRGVEVRIPFASRLETEPDEYYQSDLIGCEVIDSGTGQSIGRVRNWQDAGGSGLLEIEGSQPGQEILVPFARSICVNIDVNAKRIFVKLPEGLKELNRP